MEEIKIQGQENKITEKKLYKNTWRKFWSFLILGLIILTFFAYVGHDGGMEAGISLALLSIPIFIIFGIFALKSATSSSEKEGKSLPALLLTIFSIIFITCMPAALIMSGIQIIIFNKEFRQDVNIKESLQNMVESLTH